VTPSGVMQARGRATAFIPRRWRSSRAQWRRSSTPRVPSPSCASPRTRSSAPANAGDSFPRGAVVCTAAARRLLRHQSSHAGRASGLRSRLRYPTRSHSRASVSSTPTAGLDPPACLTLAVADPRPGLSFAQPWLIETANSEGIVQAASAPRCRRRGPGLQLRVRVRT
jgi:hypothetical protein